MRKMSVLAALSLATVGRAAITVDNLEAGELVRYPLVILKGRVDEESVRVGLAANRMVRFPAFRHRFVAICELQPGTNFVTLAAGGDKLRMRVDYRPMTGPYKAQAVWVVANDENPESTAPGTKPHGEIRAKMDVALKLMQAFTAEAMHDAGYGRKTFPLEFDSVGKVVVHTVRMPKSGSELRAMEPNAVWQAVSDQLSRDLPGDTNRWLSILGFDTWSTRDRRAPEFDALSSRKLAAFGSGSIAYWPSSIASVAKTFADRERVDPAKTFEDSGDRRTVWANASTGIGAWLHECGHTFGLGHSTDPLAIMGRGFESFNRQFMAYEPPSAEEAQERQVLQSAVPKWTPLDAATLNWDPFFQPDGNGGSAFPPSDPPAIAIGKADDSVAITSRWPLRVVAAVRDDTAGVFQEIKSDTTSLRLKRSDYLAKMGNRPYRIIAIDSMGHRTAVDDGP